MAGELYGEVSKSISDQVFLRPVPCTNKEQDQLMEEEGCDEEDCVDSARAALQYPLWGRIETRDARTQTSGCHY